MDMKLYISYVIIMALVTYLLRAVPFALVKGKVKNKFLLSFLAYIPYTVLGAMTFPAILYATSSMVSAAVGFVVAVMMSYKGRSLIKVAMAACIAVFLVEICQMFI